MKDLVALKPNLILKHQQKKAIGRLEMCEAFSIVPHTLEKALDGKPVRLFIAQKIAAAMEIETAQLVQSWE